MEHFTFDQIEKRIFRRLNTTLTVELEFSNQRLKTLTENISCGGMFLKVGIANGIQHTQENPFDCLIHLPTLERPVRLAGQICRRENKGIAVQFTNLYNDQRLALDSFVKGQLN